MSRQNFLGDEPWMPGSSGFKLHMHDGLEEIFFVLGGNPTLRDRETEEQLSPGDVVYCPLRAT
jgi:uncharacterized cupin superfamily protein